MCFTEGSKQKSKVATKDITVYKKMMGVNQHVFKSIYYPSGNNEYGKEYVSDRVPLLGNTSGFYSFPNKNSSKKYDDSGTLIKCIIPKGTKYIQGYQSIDGWKSYDLRVSYRSHKIIYVERVK